MNILDIDLDFFLRNRYLGDTHERQRLNVEDYPIWEEKDVISFLENNCCLSKQAPIRGTIFTRHHELLYYIIENKLTDINLYHVDAHEDIYGSNLLEIMSKYMHLSKEEKCNLDNINPYMDEGNFIVFLTACHKLSSIIYINDFKRYNYEVTGLYFRGLRPKDGQLQIGILPRNYNEIFDLNHISFPEGGHTTPFNMIDYTDFTAKGLTFDYIFLSKSPEYTPSEADTLIPLIEQYIKQE